MRNLENSKHLSVPSGAYDSVKWVENICANGQDSGCVVTKKEQCTWIKWDMKLKELYPLFLNGKNITFSTLFLHYKRKRAHPHHIITSTVEHS